MRAMLCLWLLAPLAPAFAQRRSAVPAPRDVLGFVPGTDRKLPTWKAVGDYLAALDRASPRITVRTLGRTTLGRPFLAAFIADSATLAALPRHREIQRRLADARTRSPADLAGLVARGKNVVLVTSSIHSTEVGGFLTPLVLAHRLVTGEDEEARSIRANTIVILVPSLNPDGVDIVGAWYAATLGTPAEGSDPPGLYHKYTGHDNNRDWYAFTQVETQLTVDSLHNVWHPVIVNDIHQQQSDGSRIFMPPYLDPWEPNVDPILTAGVNAMGTAMAWRMIADGRTGVAVNASYDAWTPARAYQHYHGGIRILTETASARLATAIDIPWDSLRASRGYDPRVSSWNFPAVWPGGRWTIGDIVSYQVGATWALLSEAAHGRRAWLESFAAVADRAAAGREAPGRASWPRAFVIPKAQADPTALATLLRVLQRGQVEIRESALPVRGVTPSGATIVHPAGSYVMLAAQPYGAFAKALLERQRYPDLREYPGGPPRRPYDVTAHTLPLLMGVDVATVDEPVPVRGGAPVAPLSAPPFIAPGLSDDRSRRIAIYQSFDPSMDEGWTRWIFDQYRIPFTSITDRDVRAGGLDRRFDAIILPDQSARGLEHGSEETGYPDSLRGGLGAAGAAALRSFAEQGGTVVAFNEASEYAIGALSLPVRNVLAAAKPTEFYAPGSLLRVAVAAEHPLARSLVGTRGEAAVWFEDGPAFEILDARAATAVASYAPSGSPLLSGWLLGGERLAGRAALVDVTVGAGHVVLFGFRPQYRGQSIATVPLLWDALRARR